jgi:hypothetical protein
VSHDEQLARTRRALEPVLAVLADLAHPTDATGARRVAQPRR